MRHQRRPQRAPGPLTTFSVPGGSSAAKAAATESTAAGHDGGVLATTVFPASSAGMALLPRIATGQLYGSMAATTPNGALSTSVRAPPPVGSRVRRESASATNGSKAPTMPVKALESNVASHSTLPCSRVSSSATPSGARRALAAAAAAR